MTSSNTGKTTRKPGTFVKGDKRINRNGQISKKRIEFNKTIRDLLIEEGETKQRGIIGTETIVLKKVEWLMKSVWKKAIEGESWAVLFIAERVEGKVTQPIDGDIGVTINRIITTVKPEE